jgi:hypothetical protein
MRRGQSSREDPTRRERWGDEEEAESSLQGRLEVSKERWRHEEGERDREETLRRDREMSRGQRAAYKGD